MGAAARHLTPVTLELGGKSPVWFDDDARLHRAARRLAWAKFTNAGQTCVAPDYVMTTPGRIPALVDALQQAITDLWGADPRTSRDYGRIVNERQFDRLTALFDGTEAVIGGECDRAERCIAPAVVTLPTADHPTVVPAAVHPLLREEVFGPVLPILLVDSAEHTAQVINRGDKPLALYVFTSSAARAACSSSTPRPVPWCTTPASSTLPPRACRSAGWVRAAWAPSTACTPGGPSPTSSPSCTNPSRWTRCAWRSRRSPAAGCASSSA